MIPMLVLTGPVGAGKTTIAFALSARLEQMTISHAVVDMDALRNCFPSPAGDPFHMALGLRNLAAVWANYRALNTERLILADIVESRAQLAEYQAAVPGAVVQILRLHASLETLHRRLAQREPADSLPWYRQRAAELSALMQEHRVEDLLVDTEGKSVAAIVEEILSRTGWRAQ